jgi:peptidyl-dipeptidase A
LISPITIEEILGFHDTSETWKNELGISNLEKIVDDLYATIQPLYVQLHAFVRGRLAAIDKTGVVHSDRPLPAHVLGMFFYLFIRNSL